MKMGIQYVTSKHQQVAIASSIVVYCDAIQVCWPRVKRQQVVCCDLERRRVALPAIFKVR